MDHDVEPVAISDDRLDGLTDHLLARKVADARVHTFAVNS